MKFKINGTLGAIRMKGGEWNIQLIAPASEATEVAKICLACQDELLSITVENENTIIVGSTEVAS